MLGKTYSLVECGTAKANSGEGEKGLGAAFWEDGGVNVFSVQGLVVEVRD